MKKWPIWHCVEHDIFGLTTIKNEEFGLDDEPIELSPLVRHISKASFHFSGNWAMESAMSLERFLMAAQKDRSVRGKLEFLRILYFCNKEDFDSLAETVEAVSLLAGDLPFKYEPMWNHCGYNWIIKTKIQIDGGFALILTQAAYNHVYFLNRSVLLDIIFPWFFPNVPWDISANYEDFMGALDDEAAIASLYDYYRPIYFDWLDRTEEERQREREANRGQTQWPVEWHVSDNEDEEANGAYHKHQYVVFETEVSDKFFM